MRELAEAGEEVKKLEKLLQLYTMKEQREGKLEVKDTVQKLRVKNSLLVSMNKEKALKVEVDELVNPHTTSGQESILVNRFLYPQVEVSFGKYRRQITSNHQSVHISLIGNEIIISAQSKT